MQLHRKPISYSTGFIRKKTKRVFEDTLIRALQVVWDRETT